MSDLREKAENATRGKWLLHTDTVVGLKIPQYARGEDWIIAETFGEGADIDAAYIAAANPQAVIALLDERDALAARVEELEGENVRLAKSSDVAIEAFGIISLAAKMGVGSNDSTYKDCQTAMRQMRQALGDHNDG